MPKLDFFSGQPEDEAMASKEASGASAPGDGWDDAFAGMQKLDLFEDEPQQVSAPEAAAPDVTQVFSVPETPVTATPGPAPQAADQKEAVGKSVFESLFADEDFEEEEPVRPAKGGLFGSRAKAKKEPEAPAFAASLNISGANIGIGLGAVVGGHVIDQYGLASLGWAAAVIVAISVALALVLMAASRARPAGKAACANA